MKVADGRQFSNFLRYRRVKHTGRASQSMPMAAQTPRIPQPKAVPNSSAETAQLPALLEEAGRRRHPRAF